jgi:hypothetical protein
MLVDVDVWWDEERRGRCYIGRKAFILVECLKEEVQTAGKIHQLLNHWNCVEDDASKYSYSRGGLVLSGRQVLLVLTTISF